jgi:hypothetical protein
MVTAKTAKLTYLGSFQNMMVSHFTVLHRMMQVVANITHRNAPHSRGVMGEKVRRRPRQSQNTDIICQSKLKNSDFARIPWFKFRSLLHIIS